jgi:electron transfer flavoprotein alpha subunit
MKIWVYAEQKADGLASVVAELLGEAGRLAQRNDEIGAVLIGNEVEGMAQEAISLGADRVYVAYDNNLKIYNNETYSRIFEYLVRREEPDIVLVGATSTGGDLAPTLAARLGTGLAAHCVELEINDDGNLVQIVPSFGGKVMAEILCPAHRPQMATIKPGVFEPSARKSIGSGEVVSVDVGEVLRNYQPQIEALEVHYRPPSGKPLEQAEVVVAGGWGIGCQEDWQLIEDLATVLDGAIGCTRPAVDEGWAAGEHMMIGTSGKTIKPKVYIGIGISGATHHLCGMKDAGTIISINKDSKATIFDVSDVKVVADFRKLVPLLIKKLKSQNLVSK